MQVGLCLKLLHSAETCSPVTHAQVPVLLTVPDKEAETPMLCKVTYRALLQGCPNWGLESVQKPELLDAYEYR